jgi:hypothetical protein
LGDAEIREKQVVRATIDQSQAYMQEKGKIIFFFLAPDQFTTFIFL